MPPYRTPYATSRTPARSLYNTSSAQPATLSLNVQSFQSTTFNGGRRIYGYHPLTSRPACPFVPSARPLLSFMQLSPSFSSSYRPKLTLRKTMESWFRNWLRTETKTILWERNGPRNFICVARRARLSRRFDVIRFEIREFTSA